MPKTNHPLAEKVASEPLLIDPGSVDLLNASISYLVNHEKGAELLDASARSGDDDFWAGGDDDYWRPYKVQNGVLQIPVQGALLNRFSYAFGRWATGYQYIERALKRGLSDQNVRGVALVIDSPGGEVAGCFELCEKIFDARGEKPIRAFASDHAYSAAFAIASSAEQIVVTSSGGTGSVGVVTAHVDYSKALENEGIKVTFIFAGKHKVDGNPYEALPDSVKARIQKRIDRIYGVFTGTVARNRSMDEKAVRDTEALTFDSEESVDRGFADRIGAFEEELVTFEQDVGADNDGAPAMTTKTNEEQAAGTFTQAQLDAAVAAAVATATTEATKAAQTRLSTILTSDEGKKRPKAAMALALKSSDSAENVIGLLADMPEEQAQAPTGEQGKPRGTTAGGRTPFQATMDEDENPEVGSDDDEGDDEEGEDGDDAKAAASMLAAHRALTGRQPQRRKQ